MDPTVAPVGRWHWIQRCRAGLGDGAVSGSPGAPHVAPVGMAEAGSPRQKNKVYFPSGCTCTTGVRGAATPSPPERLDASRTRAPSSPSPGARGPPPRPCPACRQPRPQERPPAPLPAPGPVSVRSQPAAMGSAAAASAGQLPPSPLRSLGLACAGSGCCLPLSQVGAAGPRLISATLAGASPHAPSGSCPRGPSGHPAERGREGCWHRGGVGAGGCPSPAHCHLHQLRTEEPLRNGCPGMDRQTGPWLASGWVVAVGRLRWRGHSALQGHGPCGCSVPPCSDPRPWTDPRPCRE